MMTSDKGLALIKSFEGFSARPYLCPAGVPTIGYGATYYPDGRRVTMQDKPVTEADATAMLRSMLASYEAGVSRYVLVPVTQGQFDALVSFAYNLGLSALKSSTLLRLVNARDWQGAAAQFGRWNRAGGKVLPGLTRRREAERVMFLRGDVV